MLKPMRPVKFQKSLHLHHHHQQQLHLQLHLHLARFTKVCSFFIVHDSRLFLSLVFLLCLLGRSFVLHGKSKATVADREHIRDAVYGRANNDESSPRYWVSVGMVFLAQTQSSVRLLVKHQKLDFKSVDSLSDQAEITALLDAAEKLLEKQLFSNGQGRYSALNRSTDLTDVIGYGGRGPRPIIDAHAELYEKVRKSVKAAYEDDKKDTWFDFLQDEHHSMMYTKRRSVENLSEDELVAKIFFRSAVLEEIGLFQKVCFSLFQEVDSLLFVKKPMIKRLPNHFNLGDS